MLNIIHSINTFSLQLVQLAQPQPQPQPQPSKNNLWKKELNQANNTFKKNFQNVLQNNYNDPFFTRLKAADLLAASPRQFHRNITLIANYPFNKLLKIYRLEKSKKFLDNGLRINLVAELVGFSSQSYFTSCFKKQFNHPPKAYQKQQAKD